MGEILKDLLPILCQNALDIDGGSTYVGRDLLEPILWVKYWCSSFPNSNSIDWNSLSLSFLYRSTTSASAPDLPGPSWLLTWYSCFFFSAMCLAVTMWAELLRRVLSAVWEDLRNIYDNILFTNLN